MANIIEGIFTIDDVMRFTYSMFRNRFDYRKRDVVKRVVIKQVRRYNPTRLGEPVILYEIISRSWPQYKPYFYTKSGKKYQRKVKHEYDVILQLDELSTKTSNWRGRLGSGRKWNDKPSQNSIKQIYRKTREKWIKQSKKKGKTIKEQKTWLKKKIDDHKKKAEFLDVGDYNSRVLGINGDFYFRCSYVWKKNGHLYGYSYPSNTPAPIRNKYNVVFFPKHFINVIETLANRKILK